MARHEPRLVEDLWHIRCRDGWAHADIWTRPLGWELRVLWDGVLAWGWADADLRAIHHEADEAKNRITRDGRGGLG